MRTNEGHSRAGVLPLAGITVGISLTLVWMGLLSWGAFELARVLFDVG